MNLTFQINYRTMYGQSLCIVETQSNEVGWTEQAPLQLSCEGEDFWTATVKIDSACSFTYKYVIRLQEGGYIYESGLDRHLTIRSTDKKVVMHDFWQSVDYEKAFYSTAFLKSLFHRHPQAKAAKPKAKANVTLTVDLPQILPSQGVAIVGSIPQLGEWDMDKKLPMCDCEFPIWKADIEVSDINTFDYKYVIYDLESGNVVDMEWGENRHAWGLPEKGSRLRVNDRSFRRTQPRFRGAGVAVPVFSLRTDEGFGIGEFPDLKKMADWAALTGQKMIQTLPINDTTLTHTNRDSYPYNAVSVFALHPIYINIEKMGRLTPAQKKKYEATKKEFNAKSIADY